MEREADPAIEHLKDVAWGDFMIDFTLALLALFLHRYLGTGHG